MKEEKGYNLLIQEDAVLYSVSIAYSTSLFLRSLQFYLGPKKCHSFLNYSSLGSRVITLCCTEWIMEPPSLHIITQLSHFRRKFLTCTIIVDI